MLQLWIHFYSQLIFQRFQLKSKDGVNMLYIWNQYNIVY